jgi:hypothetical protein
MTNHMPLLQNAQTRDPFPPQLRRRAECNNLVAALDMDKSDIQCQMRIENRSLFISRLKNDLALCDLFHRCAGVNQREVFPFEP